MRELRELQGARVRVTARVRVLRELEADRVECWSDVLSACPQVAPLLAAEAGLEADAVEKLLATLELGSLDALEQVAHA